jgi:hypothetical protein
MKEAPGSSETSVLTRATRRNNPEDTILLIQDSWYPQEIRNRRLFNTFHKHYCLSEIIATYKQSQYYVEERHLLGYKSPVCTSQETQYFSATEPSQLMLCKI